MSGSISNISWGRFLVSCLPVVGPVVSLYNLSETDRKTNGVAGEALKALLEDGREYVSYGIFSTTVTGTLAFVAVQVLKLSFPVWSLAMGAIPVCLVIGIYIAYKGQEYDEAYLAARRTEIAAIETEIAAMEAGLAANQACIEVYSAVRACTPAGEAVLDILETRRGFLQALNAAVGVRDQFRAKKLRSLIDRLTILGNAGSQLGIIVDAGTRQRAAEALRAQLHNLRSELNALGIDHHSRLAVSAGHSAARLEESAARAV